MNYKIWLFGGGCLQSPTAQYNEEAAVTETDSADGCPLSQWTNLAACREGTAPLLEEAAAAAS